MPVIMRATTDMGNQITAMPTLPTPPVLFIIFRRPENTARVFAAIRKARPRRLFIAADGPRPSHPDDAEKCRLAREAASRVDWPCEVRTRFLDANLGCGRAVSSAIRWFFENVEEGIVLEDDILPDPSFFPFCAALLDRYRDDPRVMNITGYNPLTHGVGDGSYYPSRFFHCWGWATWRRVAVQYDYAMADFPAFRDGGGMERAFPKRFQRDHFLEEFTRYHGHDCGNWDMQWFYLIVSRGGICLNPCVNLVKNIGFGPDSTFAANSASYHARRKTGEITDFTPPSSLVPDPRAMDEILAKAYGVSRWRKTLTRLAAPFAGRILKIIWWLTGK